MIFFSPFFSFFSVYVYVYVSSLQYQATCVCWKSSKHRDTAVYIYIYLCLPYIIGIYRLKMNKFDFPIQNLFHLIHWFTSVLFVFGVFRNFFGFFLSFYWALQSSTFSIYPKCNVNLWRWYREYYKLYHDECFVFMLFFFLFPLCVCVFFF